MAEKAAITQTTTIDPMFFIPDGVVDVVHSETGIEQTRTNLEGEEAYNLFASSSDPSQEGGLPAPVILGIIEQNFHRSEEGYNVVDIVIEIEDQDGITNYEFKVTKS